MAFSLCCRPIQCSSSFSCMPVFKCLFPMPMSFENLSSCYDSSRLSTSIAPQIGSICSHELANILIQCVTVIALQSCLCGTVEGHVFRTCHYLYLTQNDLGGKADCNDCGGQCHGHFLKPEQAIGSANQSKVQLKLLKPGVRTSRRGNQQKAEEMVYCGVCYQPYVEFTDEVEL